MGGGWFFFKFLLYIFSSYLMKTWFINLSTCWLLQRLLMESLICLQIKEIGSSFLNVFFTNHMLLCRGQYLVEPPLHPPPPSPPPPSFAVETWITTGVNSSICDEGACIRIVPFISDYYVNLALTIEDVSLDFNFAIISSSQDNNT